MSKFAINSDGKLLATTCKYCEYFRDDEHIVLIDICFKRKQITFTQHICILLFVKICIQMVIGIPITIYNLVSLRVSPIQSFNPYKSLLNLLIFVGEFDFILKKVDFMLCLTYFYLAIRITTSISNNYGHILFITNNCHSRKSLYFLKL